MVTIEVNKSLSIHLTPDEASQLIDDIRAALLALASNTNVQTAQLALFDGEA